MQGLNNITVFIEAVEQRGPFGGLNMYSNLRSPKLLLPHVLKLYQIGYLLMLEWQWYNKNQVIFYKHVGHKYYFKA